MSWCELGGERVQGGSLTIPYFGAVAGDVLLAASSSVPSQTTLKIGDLELVVHVIRQAPFAGSRGYRLVGGYGGWRKVVDRRWYASPAAIPLATVLGDVAAEVGEQVNVPSSRLIGTQYSRSRGLARRVLEQLAPDWWIAPDGVTNIGPRDNAPITTDLTVVTYSGGKGKFEIATEDMAAWLPGRTFTSQTISEPITIGAVTITMGNDGKVRLEVLQSDNLTIDRLAEPLDQIIESKIPALAYLVPWEFEVVAVHGSGPWTLDLVPTDSACPLPGMTTLVHRPAIPGAKLKPAEGSTCLVQFINGDPQRPYVSAFDSEQADEIDLNGGSDISLDPVGRVVRHGDTWQVITTAPYTPVPLMSDTPYLMMPGAAGPVITAPSSKVKA